MRCVFPMFAAAAMFAQPGPPDPVKSPEVHPDGRVTFRLMAPKAVEVTVRGEWMEGQRRDPLTKDDKGLWSATLGPLAPDLYSYSFHVDGVTVPDPRNPSVKAGSRGGPVSLVDIPGERVAFHAVRDVPHGVVHVHHYYSKALERHRRMHVYTPPGYESSKEKFPVLYLLHGAGDSDAEWSGLGRAGIILDNLLAGGKAKAMIVVMPDGHAIPATQLVPGQPNQNTERFASELLRDIVTAVESTYRVSTRREHRAITGLSMGGGQSLAIGLGNLNLFSHVGVFSSGAGGRQGDASAFEERHKQVLADAEKTNRSLKLFWIGCGKTDFVMPGTKALLASLDRHQIRHTYRESEGGHTWFNWRFYLAEFYTLLFRA